ncbi:low molecular weight protein-tyrosine-phosphatase [Streptomyces oceani]|uniref:low molecular weight protein-tyrosine-phosphatase n=1 Tax=Streptomyces oceani TaxID=1075402 RepID=UPI0008730796|nr:low molecular weight protein-tyrosine-phosphatase [Streptomyces oceani]
MSDSCLVCFVCTGNICRSPMAEVVFRARVRAAGLADRVRVDSAGIGDWHVGDEADPRTIATLAAAGYEQRHSARQFTADWFAERDLVIALDRGHQRGLRAMAPTAREAAKVRLLRSYDPAAREDLDVPDPYYGGTRGFDTCLELVEAAMPGLLTEVGTLLNGRTAPIGSGAPVGPGDEPPIPDAGTDPPTPG